MSYEIEASATTLAQEAAELVIRANAIVITDTETERQANDLLVPIRQRAKELNRSRLDATEPLREKTDAINKAFAALIDPLKAADARLSRGMSDYQVAQERKRREAERNRIAATQIAQEAKPAQAAEAKAVVTEARAEEKAVKEAAPETVRTETTQTVYVREWEVEVTDESLVPREYCSPVLAKIRSAVNEAEGKLSIPGVSVSERMRPAIRRR